MVLDTKFPATPSTTSRPTHLVSITGRSTVFTSPARARQVFRRLIIGSLLAGVAITSLVLGAALLKWLAITGAILFVGCLLTFTVWLVVDTLRSLR